MKILLVYPEFPDALPLLDEEYERLLPEHDEYKKRTLIEIASD